MDQEPSSIRAGFTATWRKTLTSYPTGGGWTLKYTIRPPKGAGVTISCTEDGSDYVATLSADSLADIASGPVMLIGYAEDATGQRVEVFIGQVNILANPLADGDVDLRGKWTQIVALLDDYFLGKLSRAQLDVRASAIGAITANYSSLGELRDFYLFANLQSEKERNMDRIASGQSVQSDIYASFT
jgi:hypothetical protein